MCGYALREGEGGREIGERERVLSIWQYGEKRSEKANWGSACKKLSDTNHM